MSTYMMSSIPTQLNNRNNIYLENRRGNIYNMNKAPPVGVEGFTGSSSWRGL